MTPEAHDPEDVITTAIQATGNAIADGALLTGYILVAEWVDPDGQRWLSRGASTGTTSWQRAGWLHEALHNWPDNSTRDRDPDT